MKRTICFCIAFLLAAALTVPAFGSYTVGLTLSDDEEETLTQLACAIEDQYGVSAYFLMDYTLQSGELSAYTQQFLSGIDGENAIIFTVSEESYYLYVSDQAEMKTGVTVEDQTELYDACRDADERGEYYNMAASYYAALNSLLASRAVDANRSAAFYGKRMRDEAALLTDAQVQELEALLEEISTRKQMDVIVRTVQNFPGNNVDDYAEAWYDASEYGTFGENRDGCMLLISMAERDWCITSTGFAEEALNAYCRATIGDMILSDLSEGDYADAFRGFAQYVDLFATQAKTGEPYSDSNPYKQPYPAAKNITVGLIVGLIISLVTLSSIKTAYKPVKMQSGAGSYMVPGSLMMRAQYDNFLYNNVTRTRKSSDSSSGGGGGSHTSSSGRSTSGKF